MSRNQSRATAKQSPCKCLHVLKTKLLSHICWFPCSFFSLDTHERRRRVGLCASDTFVEICQRDQLLPKISAYPVTRVIHRVINHRRKIRITDCYFDRFSVMNLGLQTPLRPANALRAIVDDLRIEPEINKTRRELSAGGKFAMHIASLDLPTSEGQVYVLDRVLSWRRSEAAVSCCNFPESRERHHQRRTGADAGGAGSA